LDKLSNKIFLNRHSRQKVAGTLRRAVRTKVAGTLRRAVRTKVAGTLRRAVRTKVAGTLRRAVRTKVAGTLRRAVRSQAFTRIPGGRHMECAYYFVDGTWNVPTTLTFVGSPLILIAQVE
jgi:hypothetical protein